MKKLFLFLLLTAPAATMAGTSGQYVEDTGPQMAARASSLTGPDSPAAPATGASVPDAAEPAVWLPAFPGAEGGGMYATGGRGGRVLYVTRLDDDDREGSLRWAVTRKYPRIILFKVSGVIRLQKRLNITGCLLYTSDAADE